ncbi:MAG: SurA N-terminal domain-containing protein [Treponema sp.]|jgi:hypothetical protein|nr:SurA N-terminal domain-containing protein [Treponema sp.]
MASSGKKQPKQPDSSVKFDFIQRFKANPLIFIGTIFILVIVIVAFVLVPAIVPNVGAANLTDLTFGSYDKVPITYVPGNYFARVQENMARYMQSSISDSNYQTMYYQIWRGAFEETVVHTGILQEMKRAGYVAPAEVVDREVAQLPEFQENGRFSVSKYRALDNTARISRWRDVQESIAEEHYRNDIGNLRISSKEAAFIAAMAARERRFDMVAFPLNSYPDTEVTAYAAANPDLFRVTHLSKISVNSSEREIRQILASIQDGAMTFEDAARTHSQDPYAEKGGDMGLKMAYELTSEVPDAQERAALIALSKDAYSSIVKVPSGWAFFRAEEAPYPVNTEDTAMFDKIRAYILDFERGRMEDWLINQAREFIALVNESDFEVYESDSAADKSPFDTATEAKGLTKQSFGPLPLNYGGTDLFTTLASFSVDVSELTFAGSNENFWRTAFSTALLTPSEPLVIGDNVVVLYPLEETVKEESELENIKTTYTSYWLSYYTEQSMRSYFLSSDKLEDRFMEVFLQYFLPSG